MRDSILGSASRNLYLASLARGYSEAILTANLMLLIYSNLVNDAFSILVSLSNMCYGKMWVKARHAVYLSAFVELN